MQLTFGPQRRGPARSASSSSSPRGRGGGCPAPTCLLRRAAPGGAGCRAARSGGREGGREGGAGRQRGSCQRAGPGGVCLSPRRRGDPRVSPREVAASDGSRCGGASQEWGMTSALPLEWETAGVQDGWVLCAVTVRGNDQKLPARCLSTGGMICK